MKISSQVEFTARDIHTILDQKEYKDTSNASKKLQQESDAADS